MLTDSAAVTSLTSSIFTASTQGNAGPEPAPVFGQGEKFAKNSAFVNPYQPLIAVSEFSVSFSKISTSDTISGYNSDPC